MTQTKHQAATKDEIALLNKGLQGKRIRHAGIDEHGQLWVRDMGFGVTAAALSDAMEQADAYLASKGYRRDESQPIFRDGLEWGQAITRLTR